VRESARAKLNLTLEVGPLRPDGYHELNTYMVAIDWVDAVRVRPARGPTDLLSVRGLPAPAGARNLALRAVRAWRDAGARGHVSVTLTKRLWSGAGLGGGSSDAAATLRALSRLVPLPAADPVAVAARVGSDVPFFVTGWVGAVATGRGERLAVAPALPTTWRVVLVRPPWSLSTAAVYRRADRLPGGTPPPGRSDALRQVLARAQAGGGDAGGEQALTEVAGLVRNDLWPAALSLRPGMAQVRAALAAAVGPHRPVLLAGSGSAMFALVEDGALAARAARCLAGRGLRVRVARPAGGA